MSTARDSSGRRPVQILVFSGSLRQQSLNSRLARNAARVLEGNGVEVNHASMTDFDCPSYDGDAEDSSGIPGGADALRERIDAADGFVISAPEYNASMPGVLKNAIDWTSRFRPQPFHQKHCLLMSASPSMVGGNRGAWALRVPLEHLGARVYPDMFSLAQAHDHLDAEGEINVETLQQRFEQTIRDWVDVVEAGKHYPCAKAHWIEFLGEHPTAALDRVQ